VRLQRREAFDRKGREEKPRSTLSSAELFQPREFLRVLRENLSELCGEKLLTAKAAKKSREGRKVVPNSFSPANFFASFAKTSANFAVKIFNAKAAKKCREVR